MECTSTLTFFMLISHERWLIIRAELFAHLRVVLLVYSWVVCMIALFLWMVSAAMPNPKPEFRFSFAETMEAFRKDFGTSRGADLLPPVPLPVPPVISPISLSERLVANGSVPVAELSSKPVRLASASK
jgi:hypothetical protein